MAAIHEHGLIWKDTEPGVWTAIVHLAGKQLIAYAIEDEADPVEGSEQDRFLQRYRHATGFDMGDPIELGGKKCWLMII